MSSTGEAHHLVGEHLAKPLEELGESLGKQKSMLSVISHMAQNPTQAPPQLVGLTAWGVKHSLTA